MALASVFSFALIASFLASLIIVTTRRFHGRLTHDNHVGVQKLPTMPTPRIGGVAILFGAMVGGINLPPESFWLWWMICLGAVPAFVSGLAEDLTKRVSVKVRLIATICSGLIFSILTDYQIYETDIPGVDWALTIWPVSILFTAFSIGGIANAINIIDGVNGLASGTSIIILSGFALICWQLGDVEFLGICLAAIGSLIGFFVLNFPLGRIFLGDAGAYTIGFVLAAIAVALPIRNSELSPLIGLLALSYPVTETMVSIHRRTKREGTNAGQPDRLHLHSLIYRSRAQRLAQKIGMPHLRNAAAGTLTLGMPLLSSTLMVSFNHSTPAIMLGIAIVVATYLVTYRKVALISSINTSKRSSTIDQP